MKTIKVTQNASGKYTPDTLKITLQPKAESKTYTEAVEELKEKTAELNKKFSGELAGKGAMVSSVMRNNKKLFCAHTELTIALPLTDVRAGDMLSAAEQSGVEWISEFTLKDDSYRSELVSRAVTEARASAEVIANAAGVRLGALVSVEYAAPYSANHRLMRAACMDLNADSVEPEQINAVETVTCEWEIA